MLLFNYYSALSFACCAVLALVAGTFSTESYAQTRTWTSNSGKHSIKARLLKFDGVEVKLEKENGKIINVKILKLNEFDLKYLEKLGTKPQEVEPEILPDNKSETWKFLLRVASQGYVHGSKRIEPTQDGDRLLQMAQKEDGNLTVLSRQLVLRQVMNDRLGKSQSLFGEKLETAVQVSQASTIKSSIRQMNDQYFEGGVDYVSEMELIMRDIGPMVQSGINQQVESLMLRRNVWIVESVVASQIAKMQEDEAAITVTEGLSMRATYDRAGASKKPFSAYKLVNKTETVLPWCVVVMHNDCKYTTPESEKFHNQFSNLLGEILVGGNQPDFTERTKALEAYADVDKTTVFFIENWQPKQNVKIVGTLAAEFFDTTDDVQITAYWPGKKQSFDTDVERHKTQLEKKFAPKSKRRN